MVALVHLGGGTLDSPGLEFSVLLPPSCVALNTYGLGASVASAVLGIE